jgi:hypothetical protein
MTAPCVRGGTVYALARGASGPQGLCRFKSCRAHYASLAQLAAQPACTGKVAGSDPAGGSIGRLLCRQGRHCFEQCDNAGSIPARPARALRIGVRVSLVWIRRPARHRGGAPCGCSSGVRALPCQGRGPGFETRYPLSSAGGGMQTRRSQGPVARKGREGATPSRRTESERARVPGLAANECALRCGVRVARSPRMEG